MKILHFSESFPNFLFDFFLCICPEVLSSTALGMTLKGPAPAQALPLVLEVDC